MSGWEGQGNGAPGQPRLGQLEDQSFQEHFAGMRLKGHRVALGYVSAQPELTKGDGKGVELL